MQKGIFVFGSVLFFFVLAVTTGAQNPRPQAPGAVPTPTPPPSEQKAQPCPNVSVQTSSQMVRDWQPLAFSVNISNGDPRLQPTILWSTTAGTIVRGQYTPRIEVDSTGSGSLPEREIKAEVFVTGFAPECVLQSSATVKVIAAAAKFGEFGEVPAEIVTKNLKTMTDFLAQTPDNLCLVVYAGRNSERNFASIWFKRIKDELIANGVNARRISAVDGGFREQPMFEFWLVPMGAEQPKPAPTIKREEIIYPKITPKKP